MKRSKLTSGTILFITLLTSSRLLYAENLHVAIASNFISPMKEIASEFNKETGHSLTLSFGSSGKLASQIQHGAPYDVFLSADLAKPETLINQNIADKNSLVIYAKGLLALWSTTINIKKITVKNALLEANRIAIANPKLAPYGLAAKESLIQLSLWKTVQNKLVLGENIGQTYQFTYSQNADIGIVALSQIRTGTIKGYSQIIPKENYNDINQGAVILSRTKKTKLATSFITFLMRTDIQAKIANFGYATY